MGGTSNHEYQYDDFYRLKLAKATYQGEFTKASYELNMSYNKMHNITKKDLVHTVNNEQKGYVLDYNYDNELHPNAPNKIAESGKTEPREYVYDGNGNPTSYTEEKSFRKMTWDEENRLSGINDNGRIHQFTYDATGERVIKSSGDSQNVAINGETAATIVHTDDYTGYVSPYFVISKGKFTKHYFEGAGRIVSKLGNGSFAQPLKLTAGGVNYGKLTAEQQKALDNYVKTLGVPPGPPTQQGIYATPEFTGDPYPSEVIKPVEENQEPPEGWPRNPVFNAPGDVPGPPVQFGPPIEPETVKSAEGFTGIGMPENDIFYFHPDHLGSTSYITAKNGSISQHVEYIAFGEVLFEEHSSSFSSPYLFNGKELDRETNLSYYGARYLDMKTSLWLNIDPLAEKFPDQSPYIFVFNNPLRFIDPDGRAPFDWIQWTTGDGKMHITYDAKVTTVQQAIDKGYVNVKRVVASGCFYNTNDIFENYTVDGNGNVTLSNGSSFNVHNGDTYTTSNGTFINKNKTGTEQLLELAGAFGDFLTVVGLVTLQPELVALGGYIGNGVLAGSVVNDFSNQGVNDKTLLSNGSKVAVSLATQGLGNSAVSATQKVAGKEFVETGANKVSESVIQGTVEMGGKAAGQIVDEQVKKVNQ